jgi:hypothetical protein
LNINGKKHLATLPSGQQKPDTWWQMAPLSPSTLDAVGGSKLFLDRLGRSLGFVGGLKQ